MLSLEIRIRWLVKLAVTRDGSLLGCMQGVANQEVVPVHRPVDSLTSDTDPDM